MRDYGPQESFPYRPIRTGLGLLATAPIKKGALIVEYKDRKVRSKQATRWRRVAKACPKYRPSSRGKEGRTFNRAVEEGRIVNTS